MKFEKNIKNYAKLTALKGINIQKGQYLVINSPIECDYFARMIAEEAYIAGAKEVIIKYKDEKFQKMKYQYTETEVLCDIPEYQVESYMYYAKKGAAFISIHSEDPELLKDIDNEKISKVSKASSIAMEEYYDMSMSNKIRWCVVSAPSKAWANKVYPNLSENEAVEKLWEAILKTVRAFDEDIIESWNKHTKEVKKHSEFLNKHQFKYFYYKNSLGTDLKVGMPENYIFSGAKETASDKIDFIPNIPTEEIFSMPHRLKVNGKLYSALPLNHNGNVIKDFYFEFKDGKVVNYDAKEGKEVLKSILETDEGSSYLGEIALVPYNSPISNLKILFYNTLFDENASCHFALGRAYPSCIENGDKYTKEEFIKSGGNFSLEHVDFMVGTKDLEITAEDKNGNKIQIFKNGNFCI